MTSVHVDGGTQLRASVSLVRRCCTAQRRTSTTTPTSISQSPSQIAQPTIWRRDRTKTPRSLFAVLIIDAPAATNSTFAGARTGSKLSGCACIVYTFHRSLAHNDLPRCRTLPVIVGHNNTPQSLSDNFFCISF